MKKPVILSLLFFVSAFTARAQQVDSIFFNLYTDSLKKGSLHFNYINVDGKLSDGSYMPLDTTQVRFITSTGKMNGNVLTLDPAEKAEFVTITVFLIARPQVRKETKIYVKKVYADEILKTEDELIGGWQQKKKN